MINQSIEIMGFYKLKPKKDCKVTLEDIELERVKSYNDHINNIFVDVYIDNSRKTLSIDPSGQIWTYGFNYYNWMEPIANKKLIEEATRLVSRKDTLTEFKNAMRLEFKN